jgi:hypothetical protein
MVDVIKHLALAAPLALIVLFLPAFAQEIEPPANLTNAMQDNLQLNATGGKPELEQLSEKGIYRVLFRWPQATLNAQGGVQVEIVFLNASAPEPTPENVPQKETNTTGASTPGASGFNQPSILENTLVVESYDIAIYGGDGKLLWEKQDQPGLGGRGTQRLDFEGNYTGPVTINITDIRPGWNVGDTSTAEDMTDSVSFTAMVVPEFPAITVTAIFAGSLAAGVAAMLLKKKHARVM